MGKSVDSARVHDHLIKHLLLPILDVLHERSRKSKKPRKVRQKKKKKLGWQLSSWQMFFLGGGKCPNLGVVNVRILGVVNVRLANNLTPNILQWYIQFVHYLLHFELSQWVFWKPYFCFTGHPPSKKNAFPGLLPTKAVHLLNQV